MVCLSPDPCPQSLSYPVAHMPRCSCERLNGQILTGPSYRAHPHDNEHACLLAVRQVQPSVESGGLGILRGQPCGQPGVGNGGTMVLWVVEDEVVGDLYPVWEGKMGLWREMEGWVMSLKGMVEAARVEAGIGLLLYNMCMFKSQRNQDILLYFRKRSELSFRALGVRESWFLIARFCPHYLWLPITPSLPPPPA